MAMDKAITYGKEKRQFYRGAKAIAKSCRNHGSCKWCLSNRLYKNLKKGLDKPVEKCYNEYNK